MRASIVGIGLLVATIVLGATLLDEGEVVYLRSGDEGGREHETPLWVVEAEDGSASADGALGGLWLRSLTGRADWLARVRARPMVTLERGDEKRAFRARPVAGAGVRRRVDDAMREKYGFADRVFRGVASWGRDARTQPVWLEPAG